MFDLYFFNKTVGALLFSILIILGVGIVADAIFEVERPQQPGYEIAVAEEEQAEEAATEETAGEAASSEETAASEGESPAASEGESPAASEGESPAASEGESPAAAEQDAGLGALLADASAEDGKKVARKCTACHTFDEGGANRVGPNLHGIVGRPVASHEGFAYSEAMRQKGGTWGYDELNAFLAAPKDHVPGTSMTFAGVRKDEDRADLLLYLRSVSPDAPPLPQ